MNPYASFLFSAAAGLGPEARRYRLHPKRCFRIQRWNLPSDGGKWFDATGADNNNQVDHNNQIGA